MSKSKSSVRLLLGGDSLERGKKIIAIGREFFGNEEVDRIRLSADAGETAQAVQEVLSLSLFSPCRIVILDLKKIKKEEIEILEEFLKRPDSGELPFIWLSESERDTPNSLIKILAKECKIVLKKTSQSDLRSEVQRRCTKNNVTLKPDAMKFLLDSCGDDAETTLKELEKIFLWAGEGNEVDLKTCEKIILPQHEKDIWAITNAVSKQQTEVALLAIDRLLDQGDNEIAIVGRLNGTFKSLFLCKTLEKEGVPLSEWPGIVGKSGQGLTITKNESGNFSIESLRKSISLLQHADIDLKGGKQTNPAFFRRMVLERLVIDLCNSKN